MITVSICCNDDNGFSTGRAVRIDFDQYELELEDTLWPPRGVKFEWNGPAPTKIKFGRDIWRPVVLAGDGGNIFWQNIRMTGIDCIGLMNYLMTLKHWRANAGECYLFYQFNAKKPIVPKDFFKSREPVTTPCDPGGRE
jgi:hypothetical protein